MTTRTSKRGAELKVGDAMMFLGEAHVITNIERVGWSDEYDVTVVGGVSFRVDADQHVAVEEVAPGRFDGYMSETPDGWEVSSGGSFLGVFRDESVAATTLAATSKRPTWKVTADGTVTRLG